MRLVGILCCVLASVNWQHAWARWTMASMAAAALTTWGGIAAANAPTLAEMDQYVAQMAAQDLEILDKLKPRQIWVAPDGRPMNTGAKDSPIDLKTACTNSRLVQCGTIVWIGAGNYEVGDLKPSGICGTREMPIIFRAIPGARATVIGQISSTKGCDHIWWWGVEITGPLGSGVETRNGGEGLKFINLFIHDKHSVEPPRERKPSAMGIGGWDTGNDHEFYGNIVFRNGWNTLDHGFYSQNTAAHTAKRYVDNIVFENTGEGFQIYGSTPVLRNIYFEGNAAFCTGLVPYAPEMAREPQMNVLIGGSRNPLTCVIVRNNCSYHPSPAAKRGVDIGYPGKPNSQLLIENNYFTGGSHAMELKNIAEATVRNNIFWSPSGMVSVTFAPADAIEKAGLPPAKVIFENNTYIDNGTFSLAALQATPKSGQTDKVQPGKNGRPAMVYLFKRVNRYEPNRVHLILYNWPQMNQVNLDLGDVLKLGQKFRIVEVHDIWSAPALERAYDGKPVMFKPSGAYAPEFGCYLLFREI
jgi:hypothetical protein